MAGKGCEVGRTVSHLWSVLLILIYATSHSKVAGGFNFLLEVYLSQVSVLHITIFESSSFFFLNKYFVAYTPRMYVCYMSDMTICDIDFQMYSTRIGLVLWNTDSRFHPKDKEDLKQILIVTIPSKQYSGSINIWIHSMLNI